MVAMFHVEQGGFDYVGALCGEVKGGHVNYFKGDEEERTAFRFCSPLLKCVWLLWLACTRERALRCRGS